MKHFILSIFILISLSSFAQISMLDTSYSWSTYGCCYFDGVSCSGGSLSIGGDTIINNKSYKKIYGNSTASGYPIDFFREDSGNVYHPVSNFGYEEIYYDFNLQVGDTFQFPETALISLYPGAIVESVSTIFIFGKMRKYIKFEDYTSPLNGFAFIEGVGATSGLLYDKVWYFDCNEDLTCFGDASGTYLAPGQDSCYYSPITSIETLEKKNNLITIYPNPTHNKLYITNINKLINEEVIILNSLGKIERSIEILNTRTQPIEVDIKNLKQGLYFIKTSKSRYSGKFIKN